MLRKLLALILAIPLALAGMIPASATTPFVITFESNDNSGFIHVDFDDDVQLPGHQSSSVVSGVEGNSGKVLQVVRGTASWAGTTVLKDAAKALLTSGNLLVNARINSPVAGQKLLMKIENMNDVTQSVEAYSTQDSVVGWHDYTFDFAVQRVGTEAFSTNKTYNMASVFFGYTMTPNPPTAGMTYYLDDLTFAAATATPVGPGASATATPKLLTYETNDELGAQGAAEAGPTHPMGIFGGGTAATVVDVVGLGAAGNKVLALTKSGQPWTGYNAVVDVDGSLRITNAQNPVVTFKYFSPKANSPVAIQLFAGDTMEVQLIQTANQGANSMRFDFSTSGVWSASKIYTKLVIFPDFQVATSTPADVYYFDELAINGAVEGVIPSKPTNSVVPSISKNTYKVGKTLSALKGTWAGSGDVTYKFAWYRCTLSASTFKLGAPVKANKCSAISGAKAATYKLGKSDKGKYVRAQITATNLLGSTVIVTKSTGKVS